MQNQEIQSRYELAQRISRQAGRLTLDYFQTDRIKIVSKQDGSPVTQADQAAETFLRAEIEKHFPDDSIVGEEFGTKEGSSGFCWALDPIDGTKSFITGVPLFGTMVAVVDQRSSDSQQAVIGCVYLPGLDEGVNAVRGGGAWYYQRQNQPVKVSVSQTNLLEDCVIVTSSVEGYPQRGSSLEALAGKVNFIRTWGDVYGYVLVATGRADVALDPELNIWDAAAVQTIIEEAGGTFTDWKNNRVIDGGDGVGSNGIVHQEILQQLAAG